MIDPKPYSDEELTAKFNSFSMQDYDTRRFLLTLVARDKRIEELEAKIVKLERELSGFVNGEP